jgi:hypothetical protein
MNHIPLIAAAVWGVFVASDAGAQNCGPTRDRAYSQQRREAAVRYLERLHAAEMRSQAEPSPSPDRSLSSTPDASAPQVLIE